MRRDLFGNRLDHSRQSEWLAFVALVAAGLGAGVLWLWLAAGMP